MIYNRKNEPTGVAAELHLEFMQLRVPEVQPEDSV